MAKKDKDKDKKAAYFKPPQSFEEFKQMVNDFSIQFTGKPTDMTDDELRVDWERAQERRKASKK